MKKLSEEYINYIKSNAWNAKRIEAFRHYGNRCYYCDRRKNLHIHHLNYKNLGDENIKDLRVVCEVCHEQIHHRKEKGQKPLRRKKILRKKNTKCFDDASMRLRIKKAEEEQRKHYVLSHSQYR